MSNFASSDGEIAQLSVLFVVPLPISEEWEPALGVRVARVYPFPAFQRSFGGTDPAVGAFPRDGSLCLGRLVARPASSGMVAQPRVDRTAERGAAMPTHTTVPQGSTLYGPR